MRIDDRPLDQLFPPRVKADWRAQVEAELDGRPFETLRSRTLDGLVVEPLYTREDEREPDAAGMPGLWPFVRGAHPLGSGPGGPRIRTRVEAARLERAAAELREEFARGADEVVLCVGQRGLRVDAPEDLGRLLAAVDPSRRSVYVEAGLAFAEYAPVWTDAVRAGAGAAEAVRGGPVCDPFSAAIEADALDSELEAALMRAASLAAVLRADFPALRPVRIDAGFAHDAGASPAQELATAVAIGVELLRSFEAAGIALEEAFAGFEFVLRPGTRFFEDIAALRAARALWAQVAAGCAVTGPVAAMQLHALSSERALTRRDPWGNVLRSTGAAFAGIVGGAQSIGVLPFDRRLGRPDALGRRLARNTPLVLLREAHLARVADPVGGAWFLEQMTEGLARQAWALFQQIEERGGMTAVLRSGWWLEQVEATWARRQADVATRRTPIIGVSEYPIPEESLPSREAWPAPLPGAWPRRHLSDGFESLRDRADIGRADGAALRVFLARLGSPARSAPRVSWLTHLLAAGGIEAVGAGADPADLSSLRAACAEASTPVAVICGDDASDAGAVASVAEALRQAGAEWILLAGRPDRGGGAGDGIDEYVHRGVDVLDLLRRLQRRLLAGEGER